MATTDSRAEAGAHAPGVGATDLCAAFRASVAARGDALAIRTADGATTISWNEYGARVDRLAAGLKALGVGPGDSVGSMLRNSPECLMLDTAILHLGATSFTVYNTSTPEQIQYLFGNADNRVVVTEQAFLDTVKAAQAPLVEHIVSIDGGDAMSLADLEAGGDPAFDATAHAAQHVTPDTIAVLIYTSGTTGPPKGVQLTHANLMFSASKADGIVHGLGPDGHLMSYLPFAHLADRYFAHYLQIVHGTAVTTVSDPTQIVAALPGARPTQWLAVPRIWEKLMAGLQAQGITDPTAVDDATRAAVKAKLGLDRAEALISGAAPIPVEVLEFFAGLGMEIQEGWAMSETSCVGAYNRRGAVRMGTVGQSVPEITLRIADDGELLMKGPNVMVGYRKDPEKTAEAIDADGWLHTGDIAEIDDDGYVKIVDRKKELIINAAGKNMSPANIEQRLKASSPLIGQACAIGDRRPYNTALLVLDPDGAAAFAAERGLADAAPATLAADEELQRRVADAVEAANGHLSRVEQIKRFTVLPVDWLPGGDELTPTMKLKRKPVAEKYAGEIEEMYARE